MVFGTTLSVCLLAFAFAFTFQQNRSEIMNDFFYRVKLLQSNDLFNLLAKTATKTDHTFVSQLRKTKPLQLPSPLL